MRILDAETGKQYFPYRSEDGTLLLLEFPHEEYPRIDGDTIIYREA